MTTDRTNGNTESDASDDSFSVVERRIATTRKRLRGYPHERAMLARLITHVQKRQTDLCNIALKPYDLNFVTYTALMMMYGSADQTLTPSELSNATGEKPTNVTRICDELLNKGLLERSPGTEDRRRVVMRLTEKGEQLVKQFQPDLWQTLDRIYGGFSSAQLRELTALLRQTIVRLDSEDA